MGVCLWVSVVVLVCAYGGGDEGWGTLLLERRLLLGVLAPAAPAAFPAAASAPSPAAATAASSAAFARLLFGRGRGAAEPLHLDSLLSALIIILHSEMAFLAADQLAEALTLRSKHRLHKCEECTVTKGACTMQSCDCRGPAMTVCDRA